jgi:hypothetical protein
MTGKNLEIVFSLKEFMEEFSLQIEGFYVIFERQIMSDYLEKEEILARIHALRDIHDDLFDSVLEMLLVSFKLTDKERVIFANSFKV